MQGGDISINDENFRHAKKVFDIFGCQNFGAYQDLYLTTDTLLLACVFEQFRKVCYSTYALDFAQYYSAPNTAEDAFLRTSKVSLELLSNREHLDIAEKIMRGGMSSVYSARLFTANNKYLQLFDEFLTSSFDLMVDSNNLYGGVMQQYPLPQNIFELDEDITLDIILSTSEDSIVGYILEVDLDYPEELHNSHSDFPLAPTREAIKLEWFGEYQEELREKLGMQLVSKTKKLLQTLFNKEHYTLHYITLK